MVDNDQHLLALLRMLRWGGDGPVLTSAIRVHGDQHLDLVLAVVRVGPNSEPGGLLRGFVDEVLGLRSPQ